MKYMKIVKRMVVLLLCLLLFIVVFVPTYGNQTRFSFLGMDEDSAEWAGEAVIYWNTEGSGQLPDLATESNANQSSDLATNSNAKRYLTKGSNAVDGLTPDTAVKNLNDAIKKAEKLSNQLGIAVSDIVIYAMNPMIIPNGMVYTVKGSNVSIVPWEGWDCDEDYIFIVEGGQLSLNNLTIRSESDVITPAESALLYMSSGIIQLGAEVEVDGVFVLDYHQEKGDVVLESAANAYQEPMIELTKKFDFTHQYQLDLQIPEDREYDVTVIKGLSADELSATEYIDIFAVVSDSEEWEFLAEERIRGVLYDSANITEMRMEKAVRTRKRLLARRITGVDRLWRSENADDDFINQPLGGNELNDGDETKLVVMEADGDPFGGYYQAYTANESGLRLALFDLYGLNQPSSDYIMYFGSDITNIAANLFSDNIAATDSSDVTFASLRGRLNTLVLTGHQEDLVTDMPAMSAPTTNRLISISGSGERYFGCNILLRNIRHTFGAGNSGTQGVYMNGYSLTLGGNSWQTAATRYFGGGSTDTVTAAEGTAAITVYSTGNGASLFFGGMRTGTFDGNVSITIHGTSGNVINVRGGGLGTSTSATANITGSVTNTITGMATTANGLDRFVGGVEYGTVEGQITNTISGTGRFASSDNGYSWGSSGSRFVGGSLYGDIGSDATLGGIVDTSDLSGLADTNDYIIKSNIDFSEFTVGRTSYFGTNYATGIVKGNIVNIVKAGASNEGSINVFSGGPGHDAAIGGTWGNTFTVNSATAKVTNIEAGLDAAKARASYQLYGNITSVIAEGSVCYSGNNARWFRGAGWGYMEGNAYSELGTEGVVYLDNDNNYSYSTTNTSQGYRTSFDIVGGGGNNTGNNSFCIKGDTTLVMKNVLARWTYGGNFSGVQIGDSLIVHHGGVVDTCEGTGYSNYIKVGNGRAEVYGGQIDWFLSGGGWSDSYQDGNVSVEVFDQPNVIINASMGGTYGNVSSHYISGDSSIMVHGGNFSGTARRTVLRGFSAGPSNAGYIYGNTSVTLDLRGNQYGFSIEQGDSISGGRRLNAGNNSYIGTDQDNTITLNILADDAQTDLLNGLNIYGDCSGTTGTIGNTRAGHIIINVNAPSAVIGSLYATNYSNLNGGVLRRNVEVNLVSADIITGLCAGNGTENITNAVASASAQVGRYAVINVGPQSENPEDILGEREISKTSDGFPHRIHVSTDGIIGFTSLNIHKRLLIADQGNIKNGLSVTVANHGTNYHQFGDLTLYAGQGMDGAGLGITSADATFIAGTTHVEGDGLVYIQSTGQANQIVLTDIISNGDNALEWLKVGNVSPDTNLETNWFGVSSGWRVVTLNPDKIKAEERITPVNFRGFEESTGKTFIGDSDTHFSGNNGYAVAISGSVYDWEVTDGYGMVSHNVPVAVEPPASGQLINAYGTVAADTPVTKGSIAIPSALIPAPIPYPMFSFIPDTVRGEQVERVDIYGSDQYISVTPHNYHVDTGTINQIKTWTASDDDKDFSFDIKAQFTQGDAQVTAQDVIITETQAAAIASAADIIAYTQASGEPLFQSNITSQLIEEIRMPLGQNQVWRSHLVSYSAGDEKLTGSQAKITVYVTVVKEGTNISTNQQYAIYADSVVLTLEQAQAIGSQADLDSEYTNAVVILANGTTIEPLIDSAALSEIMGVTAAVAPKDVLVSYTYVPSGQSEIITKAVIVHIEGPEEVDITISKLVEGAYGDRTREFSFQMYFWDNSDTLLAGGTELIYIGSTVPESGMVAPDDGILTLNQDGSAEFVLKHGQQITILDVPQGKVQIIEAVDSNYSVSFTGSGITGVVDGLDTGVVSLTGEGGSFEFINTRYVVVPTAVRTGIVSIQKGMLLLLLMLLIVTSGTLIYYHRKRSV